MSIKFCFNELSLVHYKYNWEFIFLNWEKNLQFGIGNVALFRPHESSRKRPGIHVYIYISCLINDKLHVVTWSWRGVAVV